MCRLTAYLGAPLPLSTLVFGGAHSLARQAWEPRELLSGSVNADGWGAAWWREGRVVRLARREPVWYDPDLEDVLGSMVAGVAVAALRNATPGLPVDTASVPPLALERWAFVLNGFLPDFRVRHMRGLRSHLPNELYAELRGASDAETLFLLAVAALQEGATPAEALERVVGMVGERMAREGEEDYQLNMLLADGATLAACRTSGSERMNSLWVAEGPAVAPGGIVVASERLDPSDVWQAVEPHHLLTVQEGGVVSRPLQPTGFTPG